MRVSILCLLCSVACLRVTTVNIGQKTSLERQLMGEFEPLSEEELLISSVRSAGQPSYAQSNLQSRALAARQRQLFNRDDIDELKRGGCLGEAKEALLVPRSCTNLALATTLLTQENQDRNTIIDWIVQNDAALTQAHRPQVVELYRRLVAQRARPGDWLQNEGGAWKQK